VSWGKKRRLLVARKRKEILDSDYIFSILHTRVQSARLLGSENELCEYPMGLIIISVGGWQD
jgi:hypothetical protein